MKNNNIDRQSPKRNIDAFDGAGNVSGNSDHKGGRRRSHSEFGANAGQFEKNYFFQPCCVNIRRTICVMGAFASLFNQSLDIIYAYNTPYH